MNDSDSEDLLVSNNVFSFPNESTSVSAKGPNTSHLTSFNLRNNMLTSTMNMPKNLGRQRYADSNFDQRSMSYRREMSPMSTASYMRPTNFNHLHYPRGLSSNTSNRSAFGRGGSPMSMRSLDSNASVSAADIAMAFKSVNFNKYDLRVIKDAYNKFMKHRIRKRIEKRRNLRLFLKRNRRRSGYDSGDLGSDSSLSSEGCKSTNTFVNKENMSSCRSTKTDIADYRETSLRGTNMYKDWTTSSCQNKNMCNISSFTANSNFIANHHKNKIPNISSAMQKDRFKSGFVLPSQRFNRSVAANTIPEKVDKINCHQNINSYTRSDKGNIPHNNKHNTGETDSESEDIFNKNYETNSNTDSHTKLPPKSKGNVPDPKLNKKSTVVNTQVSSDLNKSGPKDLDSDFIFAKPAFPIKKGGNVRVQEQLIAKSAAPLTQLQEPAVHIENQTKSVVQDVEKGSPPNELETAENSLNTVSMRPSFIKRKLFTQKLDMAEKNNASSDEINSPQNSVYGAIQKEKHKARKLVTNQSCLSRDVQQDNSNLLDLIHKIVPPDRISLTNTTQKVEENHINNKSDSEDKWDVTSIISTCPNDNVSDTYTDEEIFEAEKTNLQSKTSLVSLKTAAPTKNEDKNINNKINVSKVSKDASTLQCIVVVDKLPLNKTIIDLSNRAQTNTGYLYPMVNKKVHSGIKSFWDTDFESDIEGPQPKVYNSKKMEQPGNIHNTSTTENNQTLTMSQPAAPKPIPANMSITFNATMDSIKNSIRVKSHRTPKRKKCCDDSKLEEVMPAQFEPQSKKPKHNPKTVKSKIKTTPKTKDKPKKKEPSQSKAQPKSKEVPISNNPLKNKEVTKNKEPPKSNNPPKKKELQKNEELAKSNGPSKTKEQPKNEEQTMNKEHLVNKLQHKSKEYNINKLDPKNKENNINKLDPNNKENHKNKKPKYNKEQTEINKVNTTINNVSVDYDMVSMNDSTLRQNNRSIRSCRIAKQVKKGNVSKANDSNHVTDESLNRTLRSRQIDISTYFTAKDSNKKNTQNPVKKNVKTANNKLTNVPLKTSVNQSTESDVSFSIASNKEPNLINKIISIASKRILRNKEADASDVSFTLTGKDTPLRNNNFNRKNSKFAKNTSFTQSSLSCLSAVKSPLNKRNVHQSKGLAK